MADESARLAISATLDKGYPNEQGQIIYCLKISANDWEINISMTEAELKLIPQARNARWDNRTSLKIGTCSGIQTFWSCDENGLSILVGSDDECWDFGVTIPEEEIDNIIAEIESNK